MPTYEYSCGKCGYEFEREQRITEEPIRRCPKCRALKAKRMISTTSFILKGGGWYSDLYSSSSGKAGKSEAGAAKSETPAASESKSESKKDTSSAAKKSKTKTSAA
ncbi:MAG: zinc ribbon domain-containing protein [Deltaproteobacteria bacterium]|nr:MAG: zinc ribbon domain-containing protein [Deltaproteobacteria bacterium]